MLAKRVIPCLDCDLSVAGGRVVKGKEFRQLRYAGKPVELAEKYYQQGADEICFLDITASLEKRETMLEVVKKTVEKVFVPITVGGGIKTIKDAKKVFDSGAEKVSVNTAALERPELIGELSKVFGAQAVVVAIDAKKVGKNWKCSKYCGKELTEKDAVQWAIEAEEKGAGEILLTSMDCDGRNRGFDIELTKRISETVGIPVIASGGAGRPEDFVEVLKKGKADAVLAAGIFHCNRYSIQEVKEAIKRNKIEVRK